jgi:hypothetical protein
MTPDHQIRCYSGCRLQQAACFGEARSVRKLQLWTVKSSHLRTTGFPGVFAMIIAAPLLRSQSRPSTLIEPFPHTPELQFPIQNT